MVFHFWIIGETVVLVHLLLLLLSQPPTPPTSMSVAISFFSVPLCFSSLRPPHVRSSSTRSTSDRAGYIALTLLSVLP